MNASHSGGIAVVSVPRDSVDISEEAGIAQLVDDAARQIVIVVEDPDLGIE